MTGYAFRYTIPKKLQRAFCSRLVQLWKPSFYHFGSEVSQDKVEHIQAYLEFTGPTPSKDMRSKHYTKIDKELDFKHDVAPYFKPTTKDKRANLIYTTKDREPIITCLTEYELNELEEANDEIEEDKKKEPRDKILEAVKIVYEEAKAEHKRQYPKQYEPDSDGFINPSPLPFGFSDIVKVIINLYVNEWNKLPPQPTLMKQYAIFCAWRLDIGTLDDFMRLYGMSVLDNY